LHLKYISNANILSLNQFHLFCEHPSTGDLSDKTLEVHKNQTLGEATERAYKVDMLVCSTSIFPNSITETICYSCFCIWD